ncbi:MAG: restriction endonuclease subunit S [Clostridium sp.]|nr:restriction endonuclease subunit S [Clostridium sp.]
MKSEWNEMPLSDIVELVIDYRGKTPKKLGGDWAEAGYRALSAKNIKTGVIVQPDTIRFVDELMYKKWMKDEVHRGDIFITSEAPFGEVYFWDSDEKIVLSQRLFALRCKQAYYAPFIYYYMTTKEFKGDLSGRATGTTVVGLRQPELLKCTICVPEYNEQRQIADTLSALDARIAANKAINHRLVA